MDAETKWVPWVPKVGELYPPAYKAKLKAGPDSDFAIYNGNGHATSNREDSLYDFLVPAPIIDIDLPYLLKKSAACSPSTHAAILALKAKFADDVCKLIDADRASRLSLAQQVNEKVDA